MASLREIRIYSGYTLEMVEKDTNIAKSMLSHYEQNKYPPVLEDMFILENYFGKKLEWPESYVGMQKTEIIQSIITLLETYPIDSVLNFAPRALKQKEGSTLLVHYSKIASENNIQLLLPPEVDDNNSEWGGLTAV